MKKYYGGKIYYLFFLVLFVGVVFLTGCGGNGDVNEGNDSPAAEEKNDEEEKANNDHLSVGDTRETEGGHFTLKGVNYNIEKIDVGPAIVDVMHVKTVSAVLAGEMKEFFEEDELEYISIDMYVENTSGKDIIYFAGQAEIVTDTGEQLSPDIWMSDHIEGEMREGVKQTGNLVYIMKHSKAQDVNSVRIIIDAPLDENWNTIGEKIDVTVDL